jgi:uncharacterized protein YjdB
MGGYMKKTLLFICIFFIAALPKVAKADTNINKTNASIYIGEIVKLKVNDVHEYVMWKSSDKKIASVSKSGNVYGESEGTAKISATVGVGSSCKKYYCIVNVKSRLSIKVKVLFVEKTNIKK